MNGDEARAELALVREWALIYRSELWAGWDAAREGKPLSRIPGLE